MPRVLKVEDFDKFIFNYLRSSNYRDYIRMLRALKLIEGEKEIHVKKPKSFNAFSHLVYKYVMENDGADVLSAIDYLVKNKFAITPKTIQSFLKRKGIRISVHRVKLILRYLSSLGILVRIPILDLIDITDFDKLMYGVLRRFSPLTLWELIEKISSMYNLDRSEVIKEICVRITSKNFILEFPHNLEFIITLIKDKKGYLDCDSSAIVLSDKITDDDLKKIRNMITVYKEHLRIENNTIYLSEELFKLVVVHVKYF